MLSGMKGSIRVICIFLFATMAFPARAQAPLPQVYWAGFAYTSDQSAVAAATPRTASTIEQRGLGELNKRLAHALSQRYPQHLQLIEQPVAMLDGSTSATVLAAALDRELVSVEPIGDQYKLLVEVALQALFFDFRERQVIAAMPMTLQRIDIKDSEPSAADVNAIVADLLYGGSDTALPQVLAATLANARLPAASSRRLQVVGVTLSEATLAKLPAADWQTLLPPTLAHELSKALAANAGIALLPPRSGQAIGGAMAARFADGKVYQLKIPEPDYAIELQVDALKHGIIDETPAMKTLLFGAFFSIKVREPLSGRVYFEQPLRKGATKIVPATQQQVDLWSASYETLLAGLDAFAGAGAKRADARAWLGEQKPGGRPLQEQTRNLQELIQSCR